ncbi:hypothetical protein NDU88_007131 [Pleurodeles waltl]|uniref:Uncharacterized protein n=1 Tax=Pleurodeles waltl TaxID=8319 RepID=A0AAV7SRX8_PLEWA|nr:hypothetical protein NDU88_007131 [Pleurodeles waltl]
MQLKVRLRVAEELIRLRSDETKLLLCIKGQKLQRAYLNDLVGTGPTSDFSITTMEGCQSQKGGGLGATLRSSAIGIRQKAAGATQVPRCSSRRPPETLRARISPLGVPITGRKVNEGLQQSRRAADKMEAV